MNSPFPADIQSRINAQLASGAFTNEEDVLREAIGALERRQSGLKQILDLLSVAEDDFAAGRVGVFDREAVKTDVRSRLTARGITD